MSISELDLWRLSDELSLVDVALLASGHDPGDVRPFGTDPASCPIETIYEDEDFGRRREADNGFRAVFKALKRAVMANKISATIAYRARMENQVFEGGEFYSISPKANEFEQDFEVIIRVSNEKRRFVFGDKDFFENVDILHISRDADWYETTVDVEDVRVWFAERGVHPPFFFPNGKVEGFRNRQHPRYSPKLTCAVAAWEAVERPQPNKSVKQSLEAWVTSNGVNFGIAGEDGTVSPTAASEVAKIANWNPKGGATPTAIEFNEEQTPKRIANDTELILEEDDPSDQIPF